MGWGASGWWSACRWSVDLIKPEYINMKSIAKSKGHKKKTYLRIETMLDDGVIYVHKLRWKICLKNKAAISVHQNYKGLVEESVLYYVNR